MYVIFAPAVSHFVAIGSLHLERTQADKFIPLALAVSLQPFKSSSGTRIYKLAMYAQWIYWDCVVGGVMQMQMPPGPRSPTPPFNKRMLCWAK